MCITNTILVTITYC